MGSVRTRQTLAFPYLWCDADRLGEFVDFLYSLLEPEFLDTSGLNPLEREMMQEKAVPRWRVATRQRTATASGSWRDVADDLPWTKASDVSVTLAGRYTTFDLSAGWINGTLEISAASSEWLDRNVPLIRARMRTLYPAWANLLWRPMFLILFGTAALYNILASSMDMPEPFSLIGVGVWAFSLVGAVLPTVRLGPKPRPVWLRAILWLVGVLVVAAIGAYVQYLMFPK